MNELMVQINIESPKQNNPNLREKIIETGEVRSSFALEQNLHLISVNPFGALKRPDAYSNDSANMKGFLSYWQEVAPS